MSNTEHLSDHFPEHLSEHLVSPAHTCRKLIPSWKHIDANHIKVKPLTGGLTNHLWVVTAPNATPNKVVLKIFGRNSEAFIDRNQEKLIMRQLQMRGIGPQVLATFKEGRIESYIVGKTLVAKDLRVPKISQAIAHTVRAFHNTKVPKQEIILDIWTTLERWINKLTALFDQDSAQNRYDSTRQSSLPIDHKNIHALHGFFEKLKDRAPHTEQVLSHNDLVAGNIILLPRAQQEETTCQLIDFEYSSHGPRGFDIANLFRDWMGYGANQYPAPTLAEKRFFAQCYLSTEPNTKPLTQADINQLIEEAHYFQPVADLYWGAWCYLKAMENSYNQSHSTVSVNKTPSPHCFDYAAYGQYRLKAIRIN